LGNLNFIANPVHWYNQPFGREIFKIADQRLSKVLPKIYGNYLLQLGQEPFPSLKTSPIPHQVIVAPTVTANKNKAFVTSSYTKLPFPSNSCDLVFLPHILEFQKQSKAVLKEAWRVLTEDGHLIILGFNPWSLCGIRRLLNPGIHTPPWNGHFYSAETIRQWIYHLGGEVKSTDSFFFRPPIKQPSLLHTLTWMEKVSPWIYPYGGGVYLIVAQKRTIPLTPVKIRWSWKTLLAENKGLIPTTEGMRRD